MKTFSGHLIKQIRMLLAGIVFGLLIISTQLGTTHGRTLSTDDGYFAAPVLKRNTWWSKKSLDALDTIQHNNLNLNQETNGKCQEALAVYACYVERCVPSFVTCSKNSETDEVFQACKVLHKMCSATCETPNQNEEIGL